MPMQFELSEIQPLQDRVLVRQLREDEAAGADVYDVIQRPDQSKQKPLVGEVIAVGPGKLLDNGVMVQPSCQPGDLVLFGMYTGTDIPDLSENDTIKIMREDEIFARVNRNRTQ